MDWKKLGGEPVMWLVGVGTGITQAIMQILIARGIEISAVEQAAWTTLVTLLLALWARTQVAPMSSLPPGVAGEMADAKAARAAEKA